MLVRKSYWQLLDPVKNKLSSKGDGEPPGDLVEDVGLSSPAHLRAGELDRAVAIRNTSTLSDECTRCDRCGYDRIIEKR